MDIAFLLKKMVDNGASDLFLTVGVPPSIKINGKIHALSKDICNPDEVAKAIQSIMSATQIDEFHRTNECNFAYGLAQIGRFRVSAFIQRNCAGCVVRHIKTHVPTMEELDLPTVMKSLALCKKGLVLIVGSTGVGKTTTLASIIEYRASMTNGHILTIEDPVEYLHKHQQCIVTQREVGIDTASFEIALKNAMRQAADVIQIGEIRDANTMKYAMAFAETGHLCLATLHAANAVQALERIAHFYPENIRDQLWMDLSMNLRGIVAQQLLPHASGKERVVAVEILMNTPIIFELIRKGEINELKEHMMRQTGQGMQTFDQALFNLYTAGKISYKDALMHADSVNNLRLMIKLNSKNADCGEDPEEHQSWALVNQQEKGDGPHPTE